MTKNSYSPRIIGICGSMGAGKTLFMSFLAYLYRRHMYVMANYDLKFRNDDVRPDNVKEMMAQAQNIERKKLVLLDEVHIFGDSRASMSKQNLFFSYFITQTRKNDIQLAYTTQHFNQVDKRLRDNTDLLTFPVYNEKKDRLTVYFYEKHFLTGEIQYKFTKHYKGISVVFEHYTTEQLIGVDFFKDL